MRIAIGLFYYWCKMLQHSVIFSMKENLDQVRVSQFFTAASKLSEIQGVLNFKEWKQVSAKNPFQYGLSMEFVSHEDYQNYNQHPSHVAFIETQWIPCVADFLEIDLEGIN